MDLTEPAVTQLAAVLVLVLVQVSVVEWMSHTGRWPLIGWCVLTASQSAALCSRLPEHTWSCRLTRLTWSSSDQNQNQNQNHELSTAAAPLPAALQPPADACCHADLPPRRAHHRDSPRPSEKSGRTLTSWPLTSWPLTSWPLTSWPLTSWPLAGCLKPHFIFYILYFRVFMEKFHWDNFWVQTWSLKFISLKYSC